MDHHGMEQQEHHENYLTNEATSKYILFENRIKRWRKRENEEVNEY